MTEQEFIDTVTASMNARVAGDLPRAVHLAEVARHAYPNEASGWHTLALAASDVGMYEYALTCRQRAAECLRDIPGGVPPELFRYAQQCWFGYANSLLLAGRWRDAWPYWEVGRLGYSWSPPEGTTPWTGEDTDAGLLVVCEGGYGDLFLFARFLWPLRVQYRGRIGLFVRPGTEDVIDWKSLGVDDVYPLGTTYPISEYKYSTSIMSLPAVLGKYDTPSVPEMSLWGKVSHRNSPLRVGLCWRSEENQTKRRFRSLSVADASFLAEGLKRRAPDSDIYSLSPAGKDIHTASVPSDLPSGIVNDFSSMRTWRATQYYLTTMDLVVTVDTAVAHLAGLVGVPTLCLLPLNVDWKWRRTGDTSIWYGPQFRLFRNQLTLDWQIGRIVDTVTETICNLR